MRLATETYKKPFNETPLFHLIIEKLVYFEAFKHPLTLKELVNLLSEQRSETEVKTVLDHLMEYSICFEHASLYSLSENVEEQVQLRHQKEEWAKPFLKKSHQYGKLISSFPFVRALAISGSLSKGVIHEKGDIDYFIVTKHNRLWIARMALILYKKVFLLNSQKYFCVNYFISEENLKLKERDIFTATEIVTLLPLFNEKGIDAFRDANNWTSKFYKDFENPIAVSNVNMHFPWYKKGIESILNNKVGDWIDLLCMRITDHYFQLKFRSFGKKKFERSMRSKRNVSKHHPNDFQEHVFNSMKKRQTEIYTKLQLD